MAKAYKVITQRQSSILSVTGQVVDVMEITVQTELGNVFVEKIPLTAYQNADTVRETLAQRALHIDAIHLS